MLCLTVCLLLCPVSQAQESWTESIWQTLADLWRSPGQGSGDVTSPAGGVTVEVLWGLPDVEATVGQVFRMPMPTNAFTGPVENYTVIAG
jgi:hypothetical protein